jgi:hypothetical protein
LYVTLPVLWLTLHRAREGTHDESPWTDVM